MFSFICEYAFDEHALEGSLRQKLLESEYEREGACHIVCNSHLLPSIEYPVCVLLQ